MHLPRESRGLEWLLFWLALVAIVVGFVNFFWFISESIALGGDALNGTVRGGHYFVASHGVLTEVTRQEWEWSRLHALSVFVTHPLVFLGVAYVLSRHILPDMAGMRRAGDRTAHRELDLGVEVAHGRCSGRIGALRFSGPAINVSVHAVGLVLKPWLMRPIALPASAITKASWEHPVLVGHLLVVQHTSDAAATPVKLRLKPESELALAIEGLASHRVSATARGVERTKPTLPPPFSAEYRIVIIVGFALALGFTAWALASDIAGGFGPIWKIGVVGITAVNAYQFFIRDRQRWRR